MALTAEEVSSRYPIHWLVWNNQHEDLKSSLETKKFTPEDIEQKDPRGRTPLLLAVTLGNIECVRALLDAGADVNCEKDGWTAVQEATATGDMELLSLVLSRRDELRHAVRAGGIPDLLHRLSLAPDFYVEMKWEFTSWVPLVSRMCPFDTYKVYKRGGNVRVDTTLIGFENNRWQRGDRTYIFRGQGRTATMVELDHGERTACSESVEAGPRGAARAALHAAALQRRLAAPLAINYLDTDKICFHSDVEAGPRGAARAALHAAALQRRLAAPLAINYLDTDKICFHRNKSGIWGWRQDKTESVNGYECKVFSANNVELVSKTRTEHLPKEKKSVVQKAPLAGLLALADSEPTTPSSPLLTPDTEERSRSNSTENLAPVTWEEYFSESTPEREVGRARETTTKVQKFRATLWLCEDYPLELQEQIMPILDLMTAISSPHFAKLKDFVQMQLPAGFPVKIEIPLFHVLNARITFGNIFALETAVPHVQCIQEGERHACVIDDHCFNIGRDYREAGSEDRMGCEDGEEGLLQYAIQQSLMEAGSHDDQVDVWEALRGARPVSPSPTSGTGTGTGGTESPRDLLAHEERLLQRAIEASLASLGAPPASPPVSEPDPELQAALALSVQEQSARDRQLEDEQRALDEALRLSLIDK